MQKQPQSMRETVLSRIVLQFRCNSNTIRPAVGWVRVGLGIGRALVMAMLPSLHARAPVLADPRGEGAITPLSPAPALPRRR